MRLVTCAMKSLLTVASSHWAVLLDQDATVSNDFMAQVTNLIASSSNLQKAPGLVKIDPEDSPLTIAVRAEHAETILNAMAVTPAIPVDHLIRFLEDERGIGNVAVTAGVSGVIDEDTLRSASVQQQLATNGLLCSPRRM